MPRPWRTVYKSAHKRVMVKPRDHRPAPKPRNRPSSSADMDLSWLPLLGQLILAVFVLAFVVEMLSVFWPFLVIGLIVFLVAAR